MGLAFEGVVDVREDVVEDVLAAGELRALEKCRTGKRDERQILARRQCPAISQVVERPLGFLERGRGVANGPEKTVLTGEIDLILDPFARMHDRLANLRRVPRDLHHRVSTFRKADQDRRRIKRQRERPTPRRGEAQQRRGVVSDE